MSDPPQQSSSGSLPRGLIGRRGGAVNPSTRLPSLRPARDLTLGGVQKKAFKPNLNLAGRKDRNTKEGACKDSATPDTSKQKGQRSGRGDRGRGRGRGRGRTADTIQSHSIFEQGPADRLNKKGGGSGYHGGGDSTPSSSSSSRTIKREKMTEEESKRMQELLRDDFVNDLDGDEHDGNYCPIHLPLIASLSLKKELKQEEVVKMECDVDIKGIKKEPGDVEMKDTDQKPTVEKSTTQLKTNMKSLPERTTCASIFSTQTKTEGELLFFQFPATLPGQPMSNDDEEQRPKVKREAGTTPSDMDAQKKSKEDNKPVKCTLQNLPEGYLGKIQVLKSGKTRLVLGNVTLDATTGTPCGFLQDLMSLRLDEDERTGEIIRLGHVKNRIVCTPNFESLLQLSASK